jgi:hypothetical protein
MDAPAADPAPARLAAAAHRPDYAGGGIVNLMASIVAANGGRPRYPLLDGLDAAGLSGAGCVVLIVVDGLGYEFLRRAEHGRVMRAHLRRSMTSVFPPTTAAAVTTYLTGLAPQQHGLTGWFMYFRELGSVVAVLPFTTRLGGHPLTQSGVRAATLLGHTPVFDTLHGSSVCVTPAHIADSEFNRAHCGRAEPRPYGSLAGFAAEIERAVKQRPSPGFVYAYWPELDRLAHVEGIASDAVARHLGELDAAYEELLDKLAGTGALVFLTADHGFVDIPPENIVRLADHPRLAETLLLPLCGEPRTAYCYVAAGRERDFRRYIETELADAAVCVDSAALIDAGYFGPGAAHPRLAERVGRYTLLMRDGRAILDRLPGESPRTPLGMHGGGSLAELLVPLLLAET